ncbi:hypothetical protein ACFX2G_035251 [Malus domestica]
MKLLRHQQPAMAGGDAFSDAKPTPTRSMWWSSSSTDPRWRPSSPPSAPESWSSCSRTLFLRCDESKAKTDTSAMEARNGKDSQVK